MHSVKYITYVGKHSTPASWSTLLSDVDANLIPEEVW